jgi:putative RNA 2'-phosphotransferase
LTDVPDRRRISKLLSLILRHRPDEFGLTMDEYGYIPLGEVVEAVQQRYSAVAEEDIRTLVEDSRQRRFEITDNRIRALYAHSFFVEMDGEPIEPSESLYMIATVEAAATMKEGGIRPEDRFYLHLSANREAAESRSGSVDNPALVEIRAAAAAAAGAQFWERGEVLLTRTIDAEFVGEIVEVVGAPPRRDEGDDDRPRRPRRDRDGGRRSEGGGRRDRPERSGSGGQSPASNSEATQRIEPKPEEMTFGRSAMIQTGSRR